MDISEFYKNITSINVNGINTLQIETVKENLKDLLNKVDQQYDKLKLKLKEYEDKLKLYLMVGVIFDYKLNHFIYQDNFMYIHLTVNKIVNIIFRKLENCSQFYIESKLTKRIYFHFRNNELITNDVFSLTHYDKYHESVLDYSNVIKVVKLMMETYPELEEFKKLELYIYINEK